MAYKDFQEFLKVLEQEKELIRIAIEVDSELEITEITDRVSKDHGPAILFDKVKNSPYPVAINTFGSFKRMCKALEVDSLDDIAAEIEEIIKPATPSGVLDKLKFIPKLSQFKNFIPKSVKKGACQQVVETEPDLGTLPILKCWPGDGGRFITLPLVFSKDPETGQRNVGMYRLQVYDKNTTGMHWHQHKDGASNYAKYKERGEKMPVAVALGCDPATIYASTAPLPKGINELLFAGFLRKAPVEMVQCKTIDMEVPAHAEFVLEGYVEPGELRREGPFGDHTGYYSLADDYPVFHVTCITRKENPVYPATIVGKPPMEDCFLGKATERIFLPPLKIFLPEVVDMCLPLEGVFHNCAILSIDKTFPGQAKKVMHGLWGLGQMMYTKMIVVVDKHINPHDLSTVAWKVFNNIDGRRDVIMVDGPLDALDHSSPMARYGCKIGIDATKTWPEEGHHREWPDDIEMSDDIKEMVTRKWKEYGIK